MEILWYDKGYHHHILERLTLRSRGKGRRRRQGESSYGDKAWSSSHKETDSASQQGLCSVRLLRAIQIALTLAQPHPMPESLLPTKPRTESGDECFSLWVSKRLSWEIVPLPYQSWAVSSPALSGRTAQLQLKLFSQYSCSSRKGPLPCSSLSASC